jgi:hypothetical protein
MNDCRWCHDHMIEALYGELDAAETERLERHRRACPVCAAEYDALNATLRTMDRRERPDPGPEFWEGYWDRLSRRMLWESTEDGPRLSFAGRLERLFPRLPRWTYQAAGAAALVLIGIVIGARIIGPGGGPGRATASAGPRTALSAPPAVVQAANFVDRSKVILLGLVNYNPATEDAFAFDLEGKKSASRVLAAEAPAIRKGLEGPGQRRLRELVADLEVIMMQIANLESGQDLEGVELVKQGVDRTGLFLKIDLERLAREAGGGAAASAAPGRPSVQKKSRV